MSDSSSLEILRHSCAHIMADAVKKLFPEARVTIGPAIENGFYYDFDVPKPFTEEDLAAIEAEMRKIAGRNLPFVREEVTREQARELFASMNEPYKLEILDAIPEGETVTLYRHGDFVDLCRGPHVEHTGKVKAFKLLSTAGAYWRGDEKNPMLQRIYGTAFFSQKELDEYLAFLEEAKKRDHRRIGKELDLFSISETIGGGLVLWHPKGGRIRKTMEDFWRQRHLEHGYEIVFTPHLAREELWRQSGHLDFYKDSMFSGMEVEGQPYLVKPMNCPYHVMIYKSSLRSYRELPLRWAELGTVYRFERSGVLHGLFRVRGFTQDDAHIIFRRDQMEQELTTVFRFSLNMLRAFGFTDFICRLSTRPQGKSCGSDEIWEEATARLRGVLDAWGGAYEVDEGGGAFYGPKIDIALRDCLGRQWQCSTIQLDFNLPERFDMTFVNAAGERERPIMVHRALLGSIERFFGILLEHYAGRMPLWLAFEQFRVVTVPNEQDEWASQVASSCMGRGFRASADLRPEKLNFKIREAQMQKVPVILVVGKREVEEHSVTLRTLDENNGKTLPLEEFFAMMNPLAQWPVIE